MDFSQMMGALPQAMQETASISANLERIANALELIAGLMEGGRGPADTEPTYPEPDSDHDNTAAGS